MFYFPPKNRLIIILIIFFLLINVREVRAAFIGEYVECKLIALLSPSEAFKCALKEWGIDEDLVKNNIPYLNVADLKKIQPQVTITFSPPNPVPGEKVTASAMPMNFGNQVDSQYFTWYLQTADCPPTDNLNGGDSRKANFRLYAPGSALDKKCNLNGDLHAESGAGMFGLVNAEDYKIKAMRIYASNGFDWESMDYAAAPDNADNDGYHAILGGADQKSKDNHCYFFDPPSGQYTEFTNITSSIGEDYKRSPECFHLFPNALQSTNPSTFRAETGDGVFNKNEEQFWHTDPNAPDTAGTGHPDEANVAGLGAKDFTWTYQAGDKVGVAVEGIAADATLYKNSSYKITWAFLNGTCSIITWMTDPKETFFLGSAPLQRQIDRGTVYAPMSYPPAPGGGLHIIKMNDEENNSNRYNYNICLQKNMLAPTEGGGAKDKIDVSLSFSPTNPVNDTSTQGDNADWINVVSAIGNVANTESLHYTWNVYAGDSSDVDGSWGTPLLKSQLLGVEQTDGAGIPNLKFKANFPDAPKYLKVKLNVSEKVTSGSAGTRLGHSEAIVPLSSFSNQLSVFNALASSDNLPTLSQGDQRLCQTHGAADPATLVDAAICQVAPDEILAVKADVTPEAGETLDKFDFLWTLNGTPISYKYDPRYKDTTFKPGNLIFFPVLAPKDSPLNLSLVATSQDSGRKISLNKTFLVSEPAFRIVSTDESTAKPKLLGHYIDLDDKEWPDYSQTEFLALKDSTLKLKLSSFATLPFPNIEDLPITWYWNDTPLTATGYSLPDFSTAATEASFSLKAEGIYTQDISTKKALREYWNIPINGFYKRSLSGKIDFSIVDSLGENTAAQSGQQKILASFISSVPNYFAFLFRLVMTALVLLFAIWILFALFPKTQEGE